MSNFERPWSRLIVRHPDGVAMYVTYAPHGEGSFKWIPRASFRDTEIDSGLAQDYIDALPQSVTNKIATLNTQQALNIASERQNYYDNNLKKNISLKNVPKDGVIKNILPL